MGMTNRLGVFVVLVHLLFTFLVASPGAKAMDNLRTPLRSASVDRAQNLAELIWTSCMLEMPNLKEAYKHLDIDIVGISGTNYVDGDNFQKLLSILPQQITSELFECLKERVLVSHFSGYDESSPQWFDNLMRSLVSGQYSHAHLRRYLAWVSEDPSQEMAQSPAAGTSRFLLSGLNVDEAVVRRNLEEKSNTQDHTNAHIIIAVVATATVTFIFTLVFIFCCGKYFGISFGNGYKDESPLLGVQMSNYSDGSSSSTDFNGSYHNMSFQSNDSNFSNNEVVVSLEGNVEPDVLNASADRASTLSTDFSNLDANLPLSIKLPSIRKPPLPERKQSLHPEQHSTFRRWSLYKIRPLPALPTSAPPAISSLTPPPLPSPPSSKPPSQGDGPPGPPPPPPPIAIGTKPGVCPPPVPKIGGPSGSEKKGDTNTSKTKLKPFFWDKVLASPGHKMVWDQLKSGSFQVSEEVIGSLFGYIPPDKSKHDQQKASSSHDQPQLIEIIDAKKAHNLSILMRALNVATEEVCDALEQGHELPPELLETLLKMAPTSEEELKLRLFSGELSQLRPAEQFLKALVEIPFAYRRMEVLLFMCILKEEVATIRESFITLEAACNELTNSRLFLKLLEAVLKTGNRMNDGTFRGGADAFKLDTLLKLSDVKAVDGKVTLLHFVVTEIIKSEGIRASRGAIVNSDNPHDIIDRDNEEQMRALGLQVVSGLTGQMEHVKKAAVLDSDFLSASVSKLGSSMAKTRNFLNREMKDTDENSRFYLVLNCFVEEFGDVVTSLVEEEKRIWELIKNTADYFHGKPGKEEGLRLFSVVRDFLVMLDKACGQVQEKFKKSSSSNHTQIHKKDAPLSQETQSLNESSSEPPQHQEIKSFQQLFRAITDRRVRDESSSDDEAD